MPFKTDLNPSKKGLRIVTMSLARYRWAKIFGRSFRHRLDRNKGTGYLLGSGRPEAGTGYLLGSGRGSVRMNGLNGIY
jgi:hypothetical protein